MKNVIDGYPRLLSACVSTVLLCLLTFQSNAEQFTPDWESLDKRALPAWFIDAKFGIFIHWGVYSVPSWRVPNEEDKGAYAATYAAWYYASVIRRNLTSGREFVPGGREFHEKNYGEDFEYRDFGPLFRAELFDPDQWADIFRRAGARYVVLTSKHHDGYSLWPTESPFKKEWNSMTVGPKRDLVGDLTTAVRKAGLKMGLYYSMIEWESSRTHRRKSGYWLDLNMVEKYKIPEERYVDDHVVPQLHELVEQYHPSVLFADGGEWDGTDEYWKLKEFLAYIYNHEVIGDEVVVNDRWAKDMPGNHGDYYSSEYKDAETNSSYPWEESRGMGQSYGYNRSESLEDYQTSKELIHELIDIVSRGGNLLLNVGPTGDGRIPVIQQQRLADIGQWLAVNGDAIYETRALSTTKLNANKNLRFTQKGKHIYAIALTWPMEELSIVGKLPGMISSVSLLGSNIPVRWSQKGKRLQITPPNISPASSSSQQQAWVFQITM